MDDDHAAEVVLKAVRDAGMRVTVSRSDDGADITIIAEATDGEETYSARREDRYLAATELAERVGVDLDDLFERLGWSESVWPDPRKRTIGKMWWFISFLIVAGIYTILKGCLQGEGPLAPLFRG